MNSELSVRRDAQDDDEETRAARRERQQEQTPVTCRGAGLGGGTFWGWGCDDGEEQQAALLQARTHWEKGGASRRPRGRICRMPEHAAVQERSCPPPWPQQDSTRAGGRVCWHMSKNHKQHIPTQHTQTIHMIKPKKQFITKNHKHGKSQASLRLGRAQRAPSTLRTWCGVTPTHGCRPYPGPIGN